MSVASESEIAEVISRVIIKPFESETFRTKNHYVLLRSQDSQVEELLQYSLDTVVIFPYSPIYKNMTLNANRTTFISHLSKLIKEKLQTDELVCLKTYLPKGSSLPIFQLNCKVKDAKAFDAKGNPIDISEIKAGNHVNVLLTCNHVWRVNGKYYLSWILSEIRKLPKKNY